MHGARPTLRYTATELRPRQFQLLTDDPEQRRVDLRIHFDFPPVDDECGCRHLRSPYLLWACPDLMICERERAYAFAGCREYGVGNRGRERRRSWLADPAPLLGVPVSRGEKIRLDLRHLVHTQSAIIVEIGLLNLPLAQRDLSVKHRAQPIDDGALHLRFDNIWIDDIPRVDHADHAVDCEFASIAYGDIHDLRGHGVVAFDERDALEDPIWSLAPLCAACCFIQDG